ncbi:MAG: FAD-dependent hydroxylase [Cyanobacteria bacterium J06628_6]
MAIAPSPQPRSTVAHPTTHYNLAIVGGGIVGLTLACALQRSGLTVAIIEAQTPKQTAARQRAYAFSPMSARIFRKLGIWEQVGPYITHFQRVRMSDADCPSVVNFRLSDTPHEAVYYGAEHPVLMRALQERVQDLPRVTGWYEAKLVNVRTTAEAVCLTVDADGQHVELTTDLLVGADGARSRVRDWAGIKTAGWQYWQSCVTTVLKPEKSHQDTAYEKFWPSGPFAILPLPGDRCQVVWTAPHDEAKAMMALPHEQFMAELKRRYGDDMGDVTMLTEPLMFPVRLMQSHQYVKSRLALIGDAAHCCHPVGGQGLNMGIRDAAALAEVLLAAQKRKEDLGSLRVLKRYERWRRTENWLILGLTDILNRSFSNQFWPLQTVRRLGFWIMNRVALLRKIALRVMTGFFGRTPFIRG